MFQDFAAKALPSEQPNHAAARPFEEAGRLLQRYPDLDAAKLARLIDLYRNFAALDTAMIVSNEALAPKLRQFTADHRSKIRKPFGQYAALIGYVVVTIAAVLWALAYAM